MRTGIKDLKDMSAWEYLSAVSEYRFIEINPKGWSYMKKFSVRKSSFCIAAALCMSAGIIYYAAQKIENAVYTSATASEMPVVVLDAGHGGYALNTVYRHLFFIPWVWGQMLFS